MSRTLKLGKNYWIITSSGETLREEWTGLEKLRRRLIINQSFGKGKSNGKGLCAAIQEKKSVLVACLGVRT